MLTFPLVKYLHKLKVKDFVRVSFKPSVAAIFCTVTRTIGTAVTRNYDRALQSF